MHVNTCNTMPCELSLLVSQSKRKRSSELCMKGLTLCHSVDNRSVVAVKTGTNDETRKQCSNKLKMINDADLYLRLKKSVFP